jgi:hypothetical protein
MAIRSQRKEEHETKEVRWEQKWKVGWNVVDKEVTPGHAELTLVTKQVARTAVKATLAHDVINCGDAKEDESKSR